MGKLDEAVAVRAIDGKVVSVNVRTDSGWSG